MATQLASKRILVVEDEYYIASDLKRALEKEGATVLGPVGDLAAGLRLADESLDGAVLDVNLDGENTFAIADHLAERGVPWLFVTGYDGWAIPEPYGQAPRVSKPFSMPRVMETVMMLVSERQPV